MRDKNKTLHDILTASQAGTIVCRLAHTLDIPLYDAFKRFITSKTYAMFRTPGSYMSMLGDPAIVGAYLEEMETGKAPYI